MKKLLLGLLLAVVIGGLRLMTTYSPVVAPPVVIEDPDDPDIPDSLNEQVADDVPVVVTGSESETGTALEETEADEESSTGESSYLDKEFTGTDFTIEAELTRTNAYVRYQISYLSDGFRVSGIMNVPLGQGPFPLLILNHGYIDRSIYTNGRGLKREQDYLAREGYVVIHTDYRNHAFGDDDPELIEKPYLRTQKYGSDAINAVLAASGSSELAYINTDRVGMLGHSMGGGVTMYSLVAQPDLVDAAVLFAPVHSNEYHNYWKRTEDNMDEQQVEQLEAQIGPVTETGSFIELSPEHYFDRVTAPVVIHHGTADESVPLEWSYDIREAMEAESIDVTLYEYENGPHEFTSNWNLVMERTVEFFDEYLK